MASTWFGNQLVKTVIPHHPKMLQKILHPNNKPKGMKGESRIEVKGNEVRRDM